MRVLHVLANSPPDVNGYAVRTQNILAAQLNVFCQLDSEVVPLYRTHRIHHRLHLMGIPVEIIMTSCLG